MISIDVGFYVCYSELLARERIWIDGDMPQLYLFGDSITWGSWDLDCGGWAQRLRSEIDHYQALHYEYWCAVFNLGIPGDTSAGVLARMGNEIEARLESGEECIVLIAIGTNDCLVEHAGTSITPDEYSQNLLAILSVARKYASKIGCVGLFPIDESLLRPVSWDNTKSYTYARAAEFNHTCVHVADEAGIPSLNVWDKACNLDYRSLLFDGLHPNARGHAFLHSEIRTFLRDSGILPVPF